MRIVIAMAALAVMSGCALPSRDNIGTLTDSERRLDSRGKFAYKCSYAVSGRTEAFVTDAPCPQRFKWE